MRQYELESLKASNLVHRPPGTLLVDPLLFFAHRRIEAGEELYSSYASFYWLGWLHSRSNDSGVRQALDTCETAFADLYSPHWMDRLHNSFNKADCPNAAMAGIADRSWTYIAERMEDDVLAGYAQRSR